MKSCPRLIDNKPVYCSYECVLLNERRAEYAEGKAGLAQLKADMKKNAAESMTQQCQKVRKQTVNRKKKRSGVSVTARPTSDIAKKVHDIYELERMQKLHEEDKINIEFEPEELSSSGGDLKQCKLHNPWGDRKFFAETTEELYQGTRNLNLL